MDRRTFVHKGLTALLAHQCGFLRCASASTPSYGCRAAAASGNPFWTSLNRQVGTASWDSDFATWFVSLCDNFTVRPALGFYDATGAAARNALATPDVYYPNGPDGTVAFGLGFVRDYDYFDICTRAFDYEHHIGEALPKPAPKKPSLLPNLEFQLKTQRYSGEFVEYCKSDDPRLKELQPLLITAHEFAHILQFKWGMKVTGPWQMEPHADFMAGWYVGRVHSRLKEEALEIFAQTMFSLGDTMFNSPDHHGTPDFRASMVRKGYSAAKLDVRAAFDQGVTVAGVPPS